MPKIAACLIVRDSALTIERAIDSIRPWVDEINVYDTGSKDRTPTILRRMGQRQKALLAPDGSVRKLGKGSPPEGHQVVPLAPIRVEKGEWRDDFAWAREQSFAMASEDCDWFFWMDDDDIIVGAPWLRSLAMMAHPTVDGYVVYYDYARDENGVTLCQLWRERLIRRSDDGCWVNPVHEVWLPHGEGGPANYVTVPPEQLKFIHDRAPDRYPPTRNLEILQRQALEHDDDPPPRVLAYLGTELCAHGRFEEAVPYLERYLAHPEAQNPCDERSQIHHKLAMAMAQLGFNDAAVHVEFESLKERDDWPETSVGLMEAFFAKGDYTRAARYARRTIEIGLPATPLIINPLEIEFLPKVRLAECAVKLGQYDKAREWLEQARMIRPGDPMLLQMGEQLESEAFTQSVVEAAMLLRETLVRHDENLKALRLLENLPYVVQEHPMVTSALAMQRENVMHALKPEEYLRWYEDEPKESTVADEMVPELGRQIERAGFTLEMARRFEEEHGRKPRILDLGCNDAWLACYLWSEGSYHVDGIELNKASVKKGEARLDRFGAPGLIHQGDIHEAPQMLDEPYDIVCCYEVYEHVPDTDRLLQVMELMLTEQGMAMLTTPAGAYEQGNLQHWHVVERKGHLRAVTPGQLADQLLSRGKVEEMRLHQDSRLTWAAWRPMKRRKRVHLYGGGAWEPWSPASIQTTGIGGSETALVHVALGLAHRGFDVRVFCDAESGLYGQSLWRPAAAFDPTEECDAVIVSRIPNVFDVEIHAPVRALWCHDHTYPQLTPERGERLTHVVTLSEWERDRFARLNPWIADKLTIVRNGILVHDYDQPEKSRFPNGDRPFAERKPSCVYSSSADRGLDVLLKVWPQIRARVPDAELNVFYGWDIFDKVALHHPELREYKALVLRLFNEAGGEEGGIFMRGRIPQSQLYEAMSEARVWSYPTAFLETSCIGAMEARACGLALVTSDLGALHETAAPYGVAIPWQGEESDAYNESIAYQAVFVDRVAELLADEARWTTQHGLARRDVDELDWMQRIDDWAALIEGSS